MNDMDHLHQSKADHELLIRIDEQLKIVIRDIKEVKEGLSDRVALLEENKLDKAEAARLLAENLKVREDHYKRIESLEDSKVDKDEHKTLLTDVESLKTWRWLQTGAIVIISAMVIPLVVYIYNSQGDITTKVNEGVTQALNNYIIETK